MADYLHGAYGEIQTAGSRVSAASQSAMVYIGTAPVHTVKGGSANVNKPILCTNIADARRKLGYSDDWAKYTLCEAMHVHFELNGVGPLVFINVLDPQSHKNSTATTKNLTPENGKVLIADAEDCILDTLTVKAGETTYEYGKDYVAAYDCVKKTVTIKEVAAGALGSAALTITYSTIKPESVTAADVCGEDDDEGSHTGVHAVKDVYQLTGFVPAYMLAPGFSGVKSVHDTMVQLSGKIGDHWDAYLFADIPLVNAEGGAITLNNAKTWKNANGYNNDNETVYFPMVTLNDGKHYHISVLAAANFQKLLLEQDGIPYRTASNTEISGAQNLYMGEAYKDRIFDDKIINDKLNANGIASAAYVGGRWVIWGSHSASYSQQDNDGINVFETNRMMLFYLSNDFQHRRSRDVDKPMSANDLKTIVSEEQTRLDALMKIGALIKGEVHMNAEMMDMSDVMNGDFSFAFSVTTTPLAKSLTAVVSWTDDGFVTYFENLMDA